MNRSYFSFALSLLLLISICCEAQTINNSIQNLPQQFLIKDIKIQDNIRVEKETILSKINLKLGQSYTHHDLDQILKNIYSTGLFIDTSFYFEGTTLIIKVQENPVVNQVQIEGNSEISDEIIKSEIQLKSRQIYTLDRVRSDTQRIQDIYRLKGYFTAIVTPEIIKRDQNRVDVIFNIKEGSSTIIRSIYFIGNKNFDDGLLENTIQTKETRWYRFFTSDDNYDPARLDYDRELLRKFYLEHGYIDFQVKSAVAELTPDQKEFFITFTLHEGSRYKVGKINIKSTLKNINIDSIKESIKIEENEWYSSKDIEQTVSALNKAVGALGYAFVNIRPHIIKDEKNFLLNITFVIEEGPKTYIDKINIIHNDRTDDEVIRREISFNEGDAFNANDLDESKRNIENLGFFKKVIINRKPGIAPDLTDLDIDVEEDITGELSFGAGYSTLDGPLIDAVFNEENFLGKGQKLRLDAKISKRRNQYSIGLSEPYFMGRDLLAGVDVYRTNKNHFQATPYRQLINGISFQLGYQISKSISQIWSYRIQTDRVYDLEPNASSYIKEQQGNKLLSAITHDINYDKRDSKINPTTGYIIGFGNDLAGIGGDIKFLKNQFKVGYYYPLFENSVLELRARYGFMLGLGKKTRVADRYVLGDESLRGFEAGGVTPRDVNTKELVGGQQFYVATAEYTFPSGLPKEFGVKFAVFSDIGSVWQSGEIQESADKIIGSASPRVSVGGGIRWRSPVGIIKLDLAEAISKQAEDKTKMIHFGFSARF